MIAVPTLANPVYLDSAIAAINSKLDTLSWLTQSFGKIETLIEFGEPQSGSIRGSNNRAIRYPAILKSTDSKVAYEKLFPDESKGNFSYVELLDRESINFGSATYDMESTIGIVFWYSYKSIYGANHDTYTIENVKKEVLDKLRLVQGCVIKPIYIEEGADNIYRGFHHNEITEQFLMRPFGGFKVVCKIKYEELCS